MWEFRLSLHTHIYNKKANTNNLPHPPSLFVFLWFHAFFPPSAARLPPSSRLLDAFATPPERGLMRANDGNACRCFPFINGSTLAHQTQLFIISSLRSSAGSSSPSIYHLLALSLTLHLFHRSNGVAFYPFSSIYTYLPRLSLGLPSRPPPPLWILTGFNVVLITALCHFSWQTEKFVN